MSKVVDGAVGAMTGVIKTVVLFGVLVGLVVWGRSNPDAFQATMSNVMNAVAAIINWACAQIVSLLGSPGSGA